MSSSKLLLLPALALLLTLAASAEKKQPPPPPAHAKTPSPAVTDELIHKQFGDNCSLLPGPPQFVADMDGDGIDDLVVAARCKNPMADKDEYSFVVADPYDSFLGYSDVKVTSTFASDEPERRGVGLLIIHGAEKDEWRAETPKAKFLLINMPFKTLVVKRLTMKNDPRNLHGRKGRGREYVFRHFLGREEVQVSGSGLDPRVALGKSFNHRGHGVTQRI